MMKETSSTNPFCPVLYIDSRKNGVITVKLVPFANTFLVSCFFSRPFSSWNGWNFFIVRKWSMKILFLVLRSLSDFVILLWVLQLYFIRDLNWSRIFGRKSSPVKLEIFFLLKNEIFLAIPSVYHLVIGVTERLYRFLGRGYLCTALGITNSYSVLFLCSLTWALQNHLWTDPARPSGEHLCVETNQWPWEHKSGKDLGSPTLCCFLQKAHVFVWQFIQKKRMVLLWNFSTVNISFFIPEYQE